MRSFTETSPASILSDFGWLRVERSRHEDVLLAQREGRYLGVVNHVIESKSIVPKSRDDDNGNEHYRPLSTNNNCHSSSIYFFDDLRKSDLSV